MGLTDESHLMTGTVTWPKPKKGCLKGVKILSTGVFETIERDDLVSLLTGCGAHYYSGMSPHLHYLLVGRDAGPVKLQEAEAKNIPMLSEQEFHVWINEKIDNYVPTADDDEVDVKKKPVKGKAAAPKQETKAARKPPAKRAPPPKELEYDSDEGSGESDGDSESEDNVSDEDEEPAASSKKETPAKAPAAKRGRPAGKGKANGVAAVANGQNGVKSEKINSDDEEKPAAAQASKKKTGGKAAPVAKKSRLSARAVKAADVKTEASNGIKSEKIDSDDKDEAPVLTKEPLNATAGRRRGRAAKSGVKVEKKVAKEEAIDIDDGGDELSATPVPVKKAKKEAPKKQMSQPPIRKAAPQTRPRRNAN